MNNIFISICDEKQVSSFKIVKDILNSKNTCNIHVKFNINFIKKNIDKERFVFLIYFLVKKIQHMIRKYAYANSDKKIKFNILYSKKIEEDKKIKQYLEYILSLVKNIELAQINIKNEMLEHDEKYIVKYISDVKKDKSKLKILLVLDNINDFNYDKIIEYISEYKFKKKKKTNNISKTDYKKLSNRVDKINNEYGTTIDIIQQRNITDYHIYLMYSNINKKDFTSHFILNKDGIYVDMLDVDSDIYNENYQKYKKYKDDIKIFCNRMNIKTEEFSKLKLAYIFA